MIVVQDTIAAQSDIEETTIAAFQLGELYEPSPVQFTFETVGWPILGALVIVVLLIIAFYSYRNYRRNQYRREALRVLEGISRPDQVLAIFMVLKKTAIHAFGREEVAGLSGIEWLKFLERTGKNVQIIDQEKQVESSLYRSEPLPVDAQHQILSNAKKWIRTHAAKL